MQTTKSSKQVEVNARFGTQAREDLYNCISAELCTWTTKSLKETARACNLGYRSKMGKMEIVYALSIRFVNKVMPGRYQNVAT